MQLPSLFGAFGSAVAGMLDSGAVLASVQVEDPRLNFTNPYIWNGGDPQRLASGFIRHASGPPPFNVELRVEAQFFEINSVDQDTFLIEFSHEDLTAPAYREGCLPENNAKAGYPYGYFCFTKKLLAGTSASPMLVDQTGLSAALNMASNGSQTWAAIHLYLTGAGQVAGHGYLANVRNAYSAFSGETLFFSSFF